MIELHNAECLAHMRTMADNSVDAIVTDPPYGLSFMGKKWDYDVPEQAVWEECLRVLKPGGHLLAFAGTRTQHRMAVRIEDAGFEIRDMIAWVYGSGFPKSLDVGKAIDKAAGAERGEEKPHPTNSCKGGQWCNCQSLDATGRYSPTKHPAITAPATDAAKQWQGFGTALKPSLEPITMARKPFPGTVAANVLEHGTGAINVDGCRVGTESRPKIQSESRESSNAYGNGLNGSRADGITTQGRWPANLIHDGSDEVVGLFPVNVKGKFGCRAQGKVQFMDKHDQKGSIGGTEDTGSAARFFYVAKSSKADRNEGLPEGTTSSHPTVKPTALMRYLCRLVTPPGGTVLDPFMGSGSTGKAAVLEGFEFIGIEREAEYVEIAKARIEGAAMDEPETNQMDMFAPEPEPAPQQLSIED